MPLTLVAPPRLPEVLIGPSSAPLSLSHLETLLASSSVSTGPSLERWVCEAMGVGGGTDAPVAVLRLAAEASSQAHSHPGARDGWWLCADPIATTTGLDSIRVDGLVDDLADSEATALTRSLDDFFREDGLRFVAAAHSRWYVRAPSPQDLATVSLDALIGRSMLRAMPSGRDASTWRRRLNEAQMLLHSHPVNVEREQRGQARVGSCWWWGGGAWPAFSPARFDAIVDAPPWVASAAREQSIPIETWASGVAGTRAAAAARTLAFAAQASTSASGNADRSDPADPADPADAWRAFDSTHLASLATRNASRAEAPVTLVVPWGDSTLRIEAGARSRPGLLGRLFGGRQRTARPVADVLKDHLQ